MPTKKATAAKKTGRLGAASLVDSTSFRRIEEVLYGPIWDESASMTMKELLPTLKGGLWHVTRAERHSEIINSGGIDPNPEGIPDTERWQTQHGQSGLPFVRYIGGVSLFDFINWDIDTCASVCVRGLFYGCQWGNFIPMLQWNGKHLDSSVWIEINYDAVKHNLKLNEELEHLQHEERRRSGDNHTLLPCVEAAHIGRIPCSAIMRAFAVVRAYKKIQPLPLSASE
ncbi:MAG: hypothetical protein P4L50_29050 [Anaerolineaceae bacterium]|nr:hypothetical protein [Anaerolineaceae bacterium]